MKLTIWSIACEDDSQAYSLIGRTKKEVLAKYEQRRAEFLASGHSFSFGFASEVVKQEIEYDNAFDLFEILTGECGGRLGHDFSDCKRYPINTKKAFKDAPKLKEFFSI